MKRMSRKCPQHVSEQLPEVNYSQQDGRTPTAIRKYNGVVQLVRMRKLTGVKVFVS